MKTDRELLELASRAIGAEWDCKLNVYWLADSEGVSFEWNSLQDDGDALRLAVSLGLSITTPHQFSSFNEAEMIVTVSWHDEKEKWVSEIFESGDELELLRRTRRAITRAAAQMQLNKEQDNG